MEENNNVAVELKVCEEAKASLLTSAKWAKFLAILSLVLGGLGLLFTLIMFVVVIVSPSVQMAMAANPAFFLVKGMMSGLFIFYFVLIGVSLIPTIFLLRFATNAQKAVCSDDSQLLTESFNWQKRYYVFQGIMTIVVLALTFVALPVCMIAAAAAASGLPM
ncbi:MAG: hypothetical protein LBH06_01120 [Rikenellaceae bacterium]|nr:hypothetical protein [Rikenellaceae bacterium]